MSISKDQTRHDSATSSQLDITYTGGLTQNGVGALLCGLSPEDVKPTELLVLICDMDGKYLTNIVIADGLGNVELQFYIKTKFGDAKRMTLCKPCSAANATSRFCKERNNAYASAKQAAMVETWGLWAFDPKGSGMARNLMNGELVIAGSTL